MDFDEVLEEIGELGTFQVTTYTLICLPVLFAAANSLSYVFTAGIPNYRCYIPECDTIHSRYQEDWLLWAIPSSSKELYTPSQCEKFLVDTSTYNDSCAPNAFTDEIVSCNEWVFDNNERTIVSDWNITCVENQWKVSFVGTSHFAGIVIGSALFGILADKYGRKLIFIFCILLMSISGILQVISPEYITFITFIFINALGTSGVYPLAFIIGVELVGKKRRDVTGMVLNYFYAIGEALVALLAWLTKDWVFLQLAVSAPPILFIGYYWLVPESVRWLLANEQNQKAKGIVCRAARVNKVILSDNLLNSFQMETKLDVSPHSSNRSEKGDVKIMPVVKIILKSRVLVIRLMIVYFIWAANAFIYYGLSLNATSMSGNKYINFALVCLVEIPGYSIAWISIEKIGRRPSLVASLLVCGLTCILSVFVPSDLVWAEICLFLVGKLGITASFGIIYVHTAEMLPTIVRSGGVGSASTIARIGALLAPFVPLLGVYVKKLPMLLFGGVAVIAGILSLKLPETIRKKLPETVADALAL